MNNRAFALVFALGACFADSAAAQSIDVEVPAVDSDAAAQRLALIEVATTGGEVVRGTLLELVPGDHLVVRLSTGEERRYPWELVHGYRSVIDVAATAVEAPADDPAADASSTEASPPPLDPSQVLVHVDANHPRVRLELRVGSRYAGMAYSTTRIGSSTTYTPHSIYQPVYSPICVPPCDIPMITGVRYELRVRAFEWTNTLYGIRPVRLWVTDDVTGLTIGYRNRSRVRRALWVSVGVLPLLGVGAIYLARDLPHSSGRERNNAMFWTGIGLVASPTITFMIPLMVRDNSRVTVHRRSD